MSDRCFVIADFSLMFLSYSVLVWLLQVLNFSHHKWIHSSFALMCEKTGFSECLHRDDSAVSVNFSCQLVLRLT